jgi:hypothetical protein
MWSVIVPLHLTLKMIRYIRSLDGIVHYAGTESYEEQLEFDCLGVTKVHASGQIQCKVRKYLYGLAKERA